MRGAVQLNRPVVVSHMAPPRGNTVAVESNLFKLIRDHVNKTLLCYFLDWNDDVKDKQPAIATLLPETDFLLDLPNDCLYVPDELAIDASDLVTLTPGPSINMNQISTEKIWKSVIARVDSTHLCKDGSVDCFVSDAVVNVKLHAIVEKPHWVVSLRQVGVFDSDWVGRSLHDLLVGCGNDESVLKKVLEAQPRQTFHVECSHYASDKVVKYTVVGFSSTTAETQKIHIDDTEMTVAEYFASTSSFKQWSHKLKFPHCVLAVDVRGRFIPLELARIKRPVRRIDKQSLQLPQQLLGIAEHPLFRTLGQYGITVDASSKPVFTKARPLALNPPRHFKIERPLSFCVVSLSEDPLDEALLEELLKGGPEKSVISHRIQITESGWEKSLREGLSGMKNSVDLFIVISSDKLSDSLYRDLKLVFDLKLQTSSQFLTLTRFNNLRTEQKYWEDTWNQIAVKVGPVVNQGRPSGTVVIGIGTRGVIGTRNKAVCISMSVDNSMTLFSNQVRIGVRGTDYDMEECVYEMLLSYFSKNSVFPNRLIVFSKFCGDHKLFGLTSNFLRGAHAATSRLNRELKTGINPRIGSGAEIRPNWTLIYHTKHHGVTVDSAAAPVVINQSIVNGSGWEYFVKPALGKATRYSVIHDTNNFTQAELENFTHQITSPDCSVPRPVKHASMALRRALMYVDSERQLVRGGSPTNFAECISQKLFSQSELLFLDVKASYL